MHLAQMAQFWVPPLKKAVSVKRGGGEQTNPRCLPDPGHAARYSQWCHSCPPQFEVWGDPLHQRAPPWTTLKYQEGWGAFSQLRGTLSYHNPLFSAEGGKQTAEKV